MNSDIVEINRLTSVCSDCGNCLYYCPVYNVELTEPDSPRGKINIIRSLMDNTLEKTTENIDFVQRCLLCGSCEHNCTKGVEFTELIIKFRKHISNGGKLSIGKKLKMRLFYSSLLKKILKIPWIFPHKINLSSGAKVISTNSAKSKSIKERSAEFDILLFRGCLTNAFSPDIYNKIIRLLEKKGLRVILPEELKCCGAPYMEEGWGKQFHRIMKKNLKIFSKYNFRYIVVPCGRGTYFIRKFYSNINTEVMELSEFLYNQLKDLKINYSFLGENKKFTYHDPSYNINMLGIKKEPRYFLNKFGDRFIENSSWMCCGYNGFENSSMKKTSKKITDKYIKKLDELNVDAVLTSSPECYMHLNNHFKGEVRFITDIFE